MRLSHKDRESAYRLGWQAECAIQARATHLIASFPRPEGKDLPPSLSECAALGAAALRARLAFVRRDSDWGIEWCIVPADRPTDQGAAGDWEANHFPTREAAEAEIDRLRATGPDMDIDWIAVERPVYRG